MQKDCYDMKANTYFTILILAFAACVNDDQTSLLNAQGETIISIEPKNASVILAPDLYHNLHYIPLETNENALVGGWHKTKLFDDYIGVFNRERKNFILFDNKGKYLWHKDGGGKSPGNLSSTYDFTILNDKIYFPDHRNKAVSIYDVSGEYERTIVVNNSYSGMLGTEDYIVFSAKNQPRAYNEANQNVVFYDKDLKMVFIFGHVPKHLESNNLYDIIYRSHNLDEVLYHQVLTDTIYRVNSEKVNSYYLVNHYPPLKIDKADLKVNFNKQNGLFQKYMSNPETTYPIRNILDSKNYLILFFFYDGRYFITVYSKVENKSRTFRFDGDDIRNHLFDPTMKSTSLDNTMLIELNVEYLRGIADELPAEYLKETKIDVLLDNEAIDENSNPVILTYQLNEAYLDSVFELRF